jgi:hypothetical protein
VGSNSRYDRPLSHRTDTKAVLVNLEALFPPPDVASGVDGLKLTGWAPGALQRWERSTSGEWVGVVTFLITRSDGTTFRAEDQLVPAQALRPQ